MAEIAGAYAEIGSRLWKAVEGVWWLHTVHLTAYRYSLWLMLFL